MSEPTLYRIYIGPGWISDPMDVVNDLIDDGVLVPVKPDDVMKEAILLVESILSTDYGWEETAALRSALGIGGNG